MTLPQDAAVLVVLVVSDGATGWLPMVLDGLASQTHRPLDIVALDNATTDGSSALLLERLGDRRVVVSDKKLPYARAVGHTVTVAGERGLTGAAILFLHDDCILDPDVLEELLAALRTDGVGIAAPRLVDLDDPDVLQDIGQTTDRFGRSVPRIEREERDSGQYTGVRAVLYASSAALLVDVELLQRIGLFDERFEGIREDLDLCWRARICGALTVVCTDVRARHALATVRGLRPSPARGRLREFSERHLFATLLKNYARPRAIVAVPATLVIGLANAMFFLATGRRNLAFQVFRALGWNVRQLRPTLRERARIQRIRTEDDAVVSILQHHGSRRIRSQLERLIERFVGDVQAVDDEDWDASPPRIWERLRAHPGQVVLLVAVLFGLFAARQLFQDGVLVGADHGQFPAEPGRFFEAFGSGWRGPSGAAPTTPGMLLLGALSVLSFGSTWLAHRLLLLTLVPAAALGAAYAARKFGLGRRARLAAAVVYGLSPLVLGAFADGRLIEGVVVATLPWVLPAVARRDAFRSREGLGGAAILVAVGASLAPWLVIGVLVSGVTLSLVRRDLGPLRRVGVIAGVVLLALFPWSVEWFRHGTPLFAGGFADPTRLLELWTAGPRGMLPLALAWGLPAAAVFGAAVARDYQRPLVRDLLALGAVGLVWAALVGRMPIAAPRPALPLALAGLAAALLAGIAAERVGPLLRKQAFGFSHVAVFAAATLIVLQGVGTAGFIIAGPHRELGIGRGLVPEFFSIEEESGAFRVLWLDGTLQQPRFAITGPGGASMDDFLERPAGPGYDATARGVEILAGKAGSAAGKIFATAGIRYVVVRPSAAADLVLAVGDQIELSFEQEIEGARIFKNALNIYAAESMKSPAWATVSKQDLDAAQGVESNPFTGQPLRKAGAAAYEGTAAKSALAILLGEPFHKSWRAQLSGAEIQPRRSFGWATGFDLPPGAAEDQAVSIIWRGQLFHRVALLAWGIILFVLFSGWTRRPVEELA